MMWSCDSYAHCATKCDVSLRYGTRHVTRKFAGVVDVPKLVAAIGANRKVVVKELHGCAAVVARHRFFVENVDNGNIHNRKCGKGVCYLQYTPWTPWNHARQPPSSAKFNDEHFIW